MPRKHRLEFAGACYHVINRGNYRRDLFTAAGAADSFCRCLSEACTSYGWIAHAFSIMSNHFHLALETPEPDPRFRDEKFAALTRSWAIGSAAFRAEFRARLTEPRERANRFRLLGADRDAVLEARNELWEDQLRALAAKLAIALDRLPRQKSAAEKLTLAAAMKQTTSVSRAWLARRLQMGATDSISSLLHRFRASGATEQAAFRAALSGFRA